MPKLLVIQPDDSRAIISIADTGSYYDPTRIVWDERTDGKMPDNAIPEMVKVGSNLVIDPSMLSEKEAALLSDKKVGSLAHIDQINDTIVDMVIGRRDTEYLMAEKQAQAYIDANYEGDTYPYVDSWAQAKKSDQKWAADNIIETANNWRTLQSDMRAKRLKAKEGIRSASTLDAVDEIVNQWHNYIDIIKQQLGV